MIVVHLIVDVRDAMGANTINSMCEAIAPRLAALISGRFNLRIVSNLSIQRLVKVTGRVPLAALEGKGCESGEVLARRIVEASVFAERDVYRAATHNKGIMNGIDAVLVAFGQDWRAVEAGAHAFAANGGRYGALARWRATGGVLEGTLRLPMSVGVIGGITGTHPTFRVARRLAGVSGAADLAGLAAAVGLAQNLGALRALAAEGIQRGHMRAHARNMAVAAGAVGEEVDEVAARVARGGQISAAAAERTLATLHRERSTAAGDAAGLGDRFREMRSRFLDPIMAQIHDLLAEESAEGSALASMCAYHLETGGKRLRALLPLLVAEALDSAPSRIVPFGAACEMLHNATLVHDDLQDGDRWRRGRETVWYRFGTPQAINLGDAMFYYTLLLAARLDVPTPRREAIQLRILRETLRVIEGQDVEFALKRLPAPRPEDYFGMVEGKTSGLFALPMAGAAALCGAPPEITAALEEAARHMGVLFQIQDDVLDLYGDKGREAPGSDIGEGKRSLLVIHALGTGGAEDARRLREILDEEREATTPEDVAAAVAILDRCGSLDFALGELTRRRELAVERVRATGHPRIQELVEAMCARFTAPIRDITG
jgi:geranylgeranyl pyrophosphate synthase